MPRHLLVDLSGHGYGHLSQTAPVLNELTRRLPGLRVTVRCGLPRQTLAARLAFPFVHHPEALDFGMVMDNALDANPEKSRQAYRQSHRDWPRRVAQQARRMAALAPSLVLANVPYLSLAAAAGAGIPAVALCSLHWGDIQRHYFPEDTDIHGQIMEAYGGAPFIRLTPGMPMESLPRAFTVGPVARIGRDGRRELRRRLGMADDEMLVLAGLGGIPFAVPVAEWPRLPGVRWLVPADWSTGHPAALPWESLGLPFIDVLRASDALLTKPGYGSFAEAACNGVRVLHVPRPDWPETTCLVEWLRRHGAGAEISRRRLQRGDLGEALEQLMGVDLPPPPRPTGIAEAADFIEALLRSPETSTATSSPETMATEGPLVATEGPLESAARETT